MTKIDEILERFDERFVRKQSVLDARDKNKIIYGGNNPPIDKVKQFIRKEIEELLEGLRMEEKKPPEYNTMAGVDRDTARAESKVWGHNQAVKELNNKINKALGKEEK